MQEQKKSQPRSDGRLMIEEWENRLCGINCLTRNESTENMEII